MKKIFLFLGLAGLALGQQSLNNIGQINWTTPGLSPVSSVSAYVQGSGGTANYYYWVVAKFTAGNASPSTPAFVSGASNNLGGSQCNIVTWSGVTGATSYDLLRFASSSLPNSGNLLVANTSGLGYSDCSPSTSSYTVNSYVPQNCSWSIAANGQISIPCASVSATVTPNIPLAATSSLGTVINANAYGVSQALACIATSGSGTSYVCSTSPTVTPPLNELQINFKADVANTGTSATLQFNSGTTSLISVNGSTTLTVGALTIGWHTAIFDGTNWQIVGAGGLSPIASDTVLGNSTGSSATPTSITIPQLAALWTGTCAVTPCILQSDGTLGTVSNPYSGILVINPSTSTNTTILGVGSASGTPSGDDNTAIGKSSLSSLSGGSYNTAVGGNSLATVGNASGNVGVGTSAGQNLIGNYNTIIGQNSGSTIYAGGNNTALGYESDVSTGAASYRTAIGAGSIATFDNSIALGRTGTTANSSDMVIFKGLFTLSSGTGHPALPAASAATQACAWISDGAATPTYLRTETGGGSLLLLVCSNGTNWQDH